MGEYIKYLFLMIIFGHLALPAQAESLQLTRLQLGLNAGLTRLVLEGSGPLEAELRSTPDGLGLALAVPAVWAAPPPETRAAGLVAGLTLPVRTVSGGALAALSVGIELIEPAVVERAFRLPPQDSPEGRLGHRLVIDLRPADPAGFAAAFAGPVTLPLDDTVAATALPLAGGERRRMIVLDPGHGGQDPGAISASGRYEKDVTLAIARALAVRLERSGRYRVAMTRSGDRFVRLDSRMALARKQEADLFLSIHADSLAADRATRGASVYTRAEDATDHEAEALALRENRADQLADSGPAEEVNEVVSILLDLASRDTPRLSSRFAGLLTASLGGTMPLRSNPMRAANFKVLAAPDVPSVLLELGYLSNPADEALLFSEAGRARLADAVARAIDRYFGVETR